MWGFHEDPGRGNRYLGEKSMNRNRCLNRVNSKGHFKSYYKYVKWIEENHEYNVKRNGN